MGNINISDDELLYFKSLVANEEGIELSKETLEQILNIIVPKDSNKNNLIGISVRQTGGATAVFYPQYESISLSIKKIEEWLLYNSKDLANYFNVENSTVFNNYLIFMVLTHEVEHSYQYLMGKGKFNAPCKMIEQGYKTITELFIPKDYILPRPIKKARRIISLLAYKKRENEFLLERNAQYDSLGFVEKLALSNDHVEIARVFSDMKNIFARAGYVNNCDGTLINTFKDIYIGRQLKNICYDYEDLSMDMRFRLGLPIDEVTRDKVLSLK